MAFINPVILPFVIEYVSNPLIPVYYGYVYLICIVLATLLGSFMFYYSSMVGSIVGLRVSLVNSLRHNVNKCSLGPFSSAFTALPQSPHFSEQ
jgi:hypothetical protein